ncbi:MAG: hypothetical protein AB8B91_05100 [Rubripirellula sp.]
MKSARKRSTIDQGHDAFLDIVANLVGILIILVVVLGTQSTAVIEEMKDRAEQEQIEKQDQPTYATDEQLAELGQHSMRAAAAQADSNRFETMVKRYDAEIKASQQQRGALMDLLAQAELAWNEKKQELDEEATRAAALQTQLEIAESEFAALEGERKRLESQPSAVVAVEHLPTPMAKTVFGDELHFRLKDNRLSLVPIDKLVSEIRRDFARVAPSARQGRLNAAVGPVRGYVARYRMDKGREMVSRGGQVQMSTRIQLVGMTLEPLQEPHGNPIERVLADGGELDIELAGRDPGSTTITVWVYPGSFASFRRLKEHLYERGFATAARPLPAGHPISGGPAGSRSSAQ